MSETPDYQSMLADLQAHPNEVRVVWREPLTDAGCQPMHVGEGSASSRSDREAGDRAAESLARAGI